MRFKERTCVEAFQKVWRSKLRWRSQRATDRRSAGLDGRCPLRPLGPLAVCREEKPRLSKPRGYRRRKEGTGLKGCRGKEYSVHPAKTILMMTACSLGAVNGVAYIEVAFLFAVTWLKARLLLGQAIRAHYAPRRLKRQR